MPGLRSAPGVVESPQLLSRGELVKKLAACLLLALLSFAALAPTPVQAQDGSKNQQKAMKKYQKEQKKAQKRSRKAQKKAMKNWNKNRPISR
jgi:mannitol-specific phosphotransferase system IIBC component